MTIQTDFVGATDLEEFIRQCSLDAQGFSEKIRSALYDFRKEGNIPGYLLFRDLPVEKSSYWLTTFASLLGEPYSYVQEGDGKLFHEIAPKKPFETAISSKSSKIYLDFHTELVFHHFVPDYVMLFCIRGDRNREAKTYVSSIQTSFHELSDELIQILRKPLFKTGIDLSFGNLHTTKGNGKVVSVIYGDPEYPLLNFDPDLMEPVNEEAARALEELKKILFKNKTSLSLEPGELLIIDNKRAVHGRTPFTAYYDGQDRYLQRVFVTRDLMRASEIFSKKERIITYEFS